MEPEHRPSKKLFLECEMRGNIQRIWRHLPGGENMSRAKSYGKTPVLSVEDGRKKLTAAVLEGTPYMAARMGTSEGRATFEYWKKTLFPAGARNGGYSEECLKELCVNAGFFPRDISLIDRWAQQETDACSDLNLLGTMNFLGEEWIYRTFCSQAELMPAGGLASAGKGWAWCLEGKKVLVIHPFTDSIQKQYQNRREQIFPGTNALPAFDLKCVKAVQTVAGTKDERFADWFAALDYMTEEASKQDFDVALIGCGAYGFQLASRIKRMGKTAIHMGGSLQILFGIKGSRWDQKYAAMYNEAWVYPSEDETPANAKKVEGGCYWK